MKIVVDAMGGDFAPKVNVDGAIDALREFEDLEIILAGPQALIEEMCIRDSCKRERKPALSAAESLWSGR